MISTRVIAVEKQRWKDVWVDKIYKIEKDRNSLAVLSLEGIIQIR